MGQQFEPALLDVGKLLDLIDAVDFVVVVVVVAAAAAARQPQRDAVRVVVQAQHGPAADSQLADGAERAQRRRYVMASRWADAAINVHCR